MTTTRVLFEEASTPYLQLMYPSGPLRSLIAYYFEINPPATDTEPLLIKCLPNMTGLISVNLSPVGWLSRSELTGKQTLVRGADIFGCVTEPLSSTYPKGVHEFYVKLKPGALQQLTNLRASELTNQLVPLTDLLKTANFSSAIQDASTFADRVRIAEAMLLPITTATRPNWRYHLVQQAITYFDTTRTVGEQHLYALCRELGVSYSSLHRHFTAVVGYSPKYCQQLTRLKQGLKHYRQYGSTYAFEDLGYTDFSHFVRECKQLTYQGPSTL